MVSSQVFGIRSGDGVERHHLQVMAVGRVGGKDHFRRAAPPARRGRAGPRPRPRGARTARISAASSRWRPSRAIEHRARGRVKNRRPIAGRGKAAPRHEPRSLADHHASGRRRTPSTMSRAPDGQATSMRSAAGGRAQAEVQAQVVLGAEAAAAAHLVDQAPCRPRGRPRAPRSRCGSTASPSSATTSACPVARRAVVEQGGRVVHVVHDDVQAAAVEQVARRRRRGRPCGSAMPGPARERHVLEAAVAAVAVEHLPLRVRVARAGAVGLGIHVAVDGQQVGPAVEVEVGEADAPAQVLVVRAQAGAHGRPPRTPPSPRLR